MKDPLVRFSVAIGGELLQKFDSYRAEHRYPNRSEAVRGLMRAALIEEAVTQDEGPAMGVLTLIYDHHATRVADRLTELQHEHIESVVTTTHVHLDAHRCLEVILLRGTARDVRARRRPHRHQGRRDRPARARVGHGDSRSTWERELSRSWSSACPYSRSGQVLMNVNWQGVFAAATTQFQPDQSLDIPATRAHLDRLIDAGVHGIILLGTVGENGALEPAEKRDLLRATVEHIRMRVPVLAGVAENTTAAACRFAALARDQGVDGLMVLPAMVYKADARETLAHFRAVAAATDLPVMIYNNPVSYHVDVTPEMFAELAEEPRFVAIKESSENVRRITDLVNACGDRYRLFCGVDDLVLESVLLGAVGWVSGLVNAFPAENRLLWDLAASGRWDEARRVYRWYTPLLHLDTHVKLVQYIKLAMRECGLGSETVRARACRWSATERERILAIVREAIATRPIG